MRCSDCADDLADSLDEMEPEPFLSKLNEVLGTDYDLELYANLATETVAILLNALYERQLLGCKDAEFIQDGSSLCRKHMARRLMQ